MNRFLLAAAVAFPLLMLYPDPMAISDWHNNTLMAGYMGTYYRAHGELPLILNFEDGGGAAYPIFYGTIYFKIFGFLSAWLAPEFILRVAVIALFALQFHVIRKTLLLLDASELAAMTISCLVIWAIYPMTNLYPRGAIPELFATGLLTCIVGYWFQILVAANWRELLSRALIFGLCLTVAGGTHPITAAYTVLVVLTLCVTLAWPPPHMSRLAIVGTLAAAAVPTLVILLPWVYALGPVRPYLWISREVVMTMGAYYDSLDSLFQRLWPFPFDVRMMFLDYKDVSCPYLHAPINGFLAVLAASICWQNWGSLSRRERYLVLGYAVLALLTLIGSLDAELLMSGPRLLQFVQFLYRLVTYVNLFLLLTILALLYVFRTRRLKMAPLNPLLVCFLLTVAGCAVVEKLQVSFPSRRPESSISGWPRLLETDWSRLRYREAGKHFLPSHVAYATPSLFELWGDAFGRRDDPELHKFPLAPPGNVDPGFGFYLPMDLDFDKPKYIRTQILVFPWSHFYLDGERLPQGKIMCWRPWSPQAAMLIPAGRHRLEYRFEPDPTYVLLNRISTWTLVAWLAVVASFCIWRGLRPRSAGAGAPDLVE